jgi:hypothetical protein
MDAETYWRELKNVGWLDCIPQGQHADLRKRIERSLLGSAPETTCFTLTQSSLDSECILGEGSYARILKDLAEASDGVFSPAHVVDRCEPNQTVGTVSFVHARKQYDLKVSYDTDLLDEAIIDLVNEAISNGGSDRQFINLPVIDQCYYLVFVPRAVYEKAIEVGLLPDTDAIDMFDGRGSE